MTKSEICLQDSAFIGPGLLFLDQYFNSFIDEYIVLWIALVSVLYFLFGPYLKEQIENCPCHSALPFLTCSHFSSHCGGSGRVPFKHVFGSCLACFPWNRDVKVNL